MVFRLSLDKLIARAGAILAAAALCIWLGYLAISHFIVGVLTDESISVSSQMLAAASEHFPNSARLRIRLAAMGLAETSGDDHVLEQVKISALQAVNLSPFNATARLLLAKSMELSGEAEAAEDVLRAAVLLAPGDTNLHWQLANTLVRRGNLDGARAEFRIAIAADRSFLSPALDLLWQVSGGDVKILDEVTGGASASRLGLAQFLLTQARTNDSVSVFSQIPRQEKLSPLLVGDTAAFIDKLIALGEWEQSRRLWIDLFRNQEEVPLVWNGGFELDLLSVLTQFDWNLGSTEYAVIKVEEGIGRSGPRSLRIDFTGRDTTKLTSEIQQLVILRPGAHYRLECYAKASRLVTPEGPRLAVTARNSSQPLAVSLPVAANEADWQQLMAEFTVPANQSAVSVTIQRIPKYGYDDPTKGTIWFDDFKLAEYSPSAKQQKTMAQKRDND